ncbi:MAG: clan AA aspartic protease, partial [Flavobacteriales bacterium]
QSTDGRFGWDLFDGKIIEIDYDKNLFIVHTKLTKKIKGYSRFEMEYTRGVFYIHGNLQINNKKYQNRFLFHTGYQRTIMLDTLLLQEQYFPKDLEVIKKVIMKNGKGDEIPVITVNIKQLNLGKESILNIPVQVMTTENPVGFKIHILGNEVLKRFNAILDFQNNYVYLKPNTLVDLPYIDAK